MGERRVREKFRFFIASRTTCQSANLRIILSSSANKSRAGFFSVVVKRRDVVPAHCWRYIPALHRNFSALPLAPPISSCFFRSSLPPPPLLHLLGDTLPDARAAPGPVPTFCLSRESTWPPFPVIFSPPLPACLLSPALTRAPSVPSLKIISRADGTRK